MTEDLLQKKRRYPRIELPNGMWVAWQGGGARAVTRAHTLGLGGLFIATPEPPPVGTVVKVLFEALGGVVRARARVRNTQSARGMGIEFTGMGYQDRTRLYQLVERLSHQPFTPATE